MSDDAKIQAPAGPAAPDRELPRKRRWQLRVYFETWLLSAFIAFAFSMMWHLGEIAEKRAGAGSIGGVFLIAPIVSSLSLPALWLLRIFRESSPSTWLRFVRRIVLGAVCGAFPAALLAALTAHKDGQEAGNALVLWVFGLVFGIVAGFVDAMHMDSAALRESAAQRERGDDDLV